jgi:hypothetical protein
MRETVALMKHPEGEKNGFRAHDERIHYFNKGVPTQNFGDYLSELLAKEFMLHPRVEADVYRLIGSVIDPKTILGDLRHTIGLQSGHIAFWCCGVRNKNPIDSNVRAMCSFFGARGPMTRDVLSLPANTVLGDPGLLAPLFHRPLPVPQYENRAICVPHYYDLKPDAELLKISGADLVLRPEIGASEHDLLEILNRIASASFVLTGSLHAAIIACAYGRPFAFWDNGHVDIPFKWEDFSGSVNIPCLFAKNVAEGWTIYKESIAPQLRIPPLSPILQICPFFIRPSKLLQALAHDGALCTDDTRLAAQVLEDLDCFKSSTVYQLQERSARYRANRDRLHQLIRVRVVRTKRAVKKILMKIIFP